MRPRTTVLFLLGLAACAGGNTGSGKEGNLPRRSIDEVLAAHNDSLLARPGVVGTAIGLCESERCIVIYLRDSTSLHAAKIPDRLEGYRVKLEVSGPFNPR